MTKLIRFLDSVSVKVGRISNVVSDKPTNPSAKHKFWVNAKHVFWSERLRIIETDRKILRNCDVIMKSSFKITCYANSEIDSGDSNKNECRYKNEKIFCWWNAENTYQSNDSWQWHINYVT